jgi:hypothetical protein
MESAMRELCLVVGSGLAGWIAVEFMAAIQKAQIPLGLNFMGMAAGMLISVGPGR